MVLLILVFIGIIIAFIARSYQDERKSTPVHYRYYQDDDEDDYERTSVEDRSYFSDDLADDYNSYYMQTYDDAIMGDCDAIDELREEFGDDWGGEF